MKTKEDVANRFYQTCPSWDWAFGSDESREMSEALLRITPVLNFDMSEFLLATGNQS